MIEAKITGLEELQAKLKNLSAETQYKGGRFALRKAAQIVRDAARDGASRVDDSATRESIEKNIAERFNVQSFKRNGDLMFRIGVLGGARNYEAYGEFKTGKKASNNPGGDTFYWRFLEFGTEKMQARPFMRQALENNLQAATDEFVAQYNKAVDRAIAKGKG